MAKQVLIQFSHDNPKARFDGTYSFMSGESRMVPYDYAQKLFADYPNYFSEVSVATDTVGEFAPNDDSDVVTDWRNPSLSTRIRGYTIYFTNKFKRFFQIKKRRVQCS